MAASMYAALAGQKRRNEKLLKDARYLGQRVRSQVLPLQVDIAKDKALSEATRKQKLAEDLRSNDALLAKRLLHAQLRHLGGERFLSLAEASA